MILHPFFFSFGNSLLNTDLIFLENINSADDNLKLVLGVSVARYPLKNYRIRFCPTFLMLSWKCLQNISPVY